jgi:hypothetical protein
MLYHCIVCAQAHLVHSGAAQTVLAAMRTHSGCADVQHRALFALINLATPEPQPTAATAVVVSTTAAAQGMSTMSSLK